MGREGWASGPKSPPELLLHTSWLGGAGVGYSPVGIQGAEGGNKRVSLSRGTHTQKVVHPHNGTLFNLRKNMREHQTLCSLKEKEHKRAHVHVSIYRESAEQTDTLNTDWW